MVCDVQKKTQIRSLERSNWVCLKSRFFRNKKEGKSPLFYDINLLKSGNVTDYFKGIGIDDDANWTEEWVI